MRDITEVATTLGLILVLTILFTAILPRLPLERKTHAKSSTTQDTTCLITTLLHWLSAICTTSPLRDHTHRVSTARKMGIYLAGKALVLLGLPFRRTFQYLLPHSHHSDNPLVMKCVEGPYRMESIMVTVYCVFSALNWNSKRPVPLCLFLLQHQILVSLSHTL